MSLNAIPRVTERPIDDDLLRVVEKETGLTGIAILGIELQDKTQKKSLVILRNFDKFNKDFNAAVELFYQNLEIRFQGEVINLRKPQIAERSIDADLLTSIETKTGFTGVAVIGISVAVEQKSLVILRDMNKFNEAFNAWVGGREKGPEVVINGSVVKLCTW